MRLGIAHHLIYLVLPQARRRGYGDLLLSPGAEVLGRYIDDAVGIDIEGHLYLRNAARCGGNPDEMELAKCAVLRSHRPLALKHVDLDRCLTVGSGGENL